MAADRPLLVWSKAFYFCYYAAAAALLPFLALHFDDLGLSGRQIGFLAGIIPLVSLVGAPFWSAFADAVRFHITILGVVIAGAVTLSLLIS